MAESLSNAELIAELAREFWWPHHASRNRDKALEALDGGDLGVVSLEYEDFENLAGWVVELLRLRRVTPDDDLMMRLVRAVPDQRSPSKGKGNG